MAFHAEMMGDIMYLQQALKQQDAPQFAEAVNLQTCGQKALGTCEMGLCT